MFSIKTVKDKEKQSCLKSKMHNINSKRHEIYHILKIPLTEISQIIRWSNYSVNFLHGN